MSTFKAIANAQRTCKIGLSKAKNDTERLLWKKKLDAINQLIVFAKRGGYAPEEAKKRAIVIFKEGYKVAVERFKLSRQALSRQFARTDSALAEFVPNLVIGLIMSGAVGAGLALFRDRQKARDGHMFFPKGIRQLLPEPIDDKDHKAIDLLTGFSPEIELLQSLTVHSICERISRCDLDKLALLVGFFTLPSVDKSQLIEISKLVADVPESDWD